MPELRQRLALLGRRHVDRWSLGGVGVLNLNTTETKAERADVQTAVPSAQTRRSLPSRHLFRIGASACLNRINRVTAPVAAAIGGAADNLPHDDRARGRAGISSQRQAARCKGVRAGVVRANVANYPGHRAIGADLWQPTYGELNEAANALAETILGHGGARGDHDCSSPSAKISLSQCCAAPKSRSKSA
jgi:non-ribosomal peptide synthetase component F